MSDATLKRTKDRPRWLLPVLIAFTVAGALLLVPAAVMGMMSPMLSDSGLNAGVWALILGVALAPIVLLASLVVAWIGYGTARYRLAVMAMCAPPLWLAYIAAAFAAVALLPPHN